MLTIHELHHPAIHARNLTLAEGRAAHLTGPSGAGKSVFLRCLADLLPWRGDIQLNGRSVWQQPAPQWRRHVSYCGPDSAWWLPTIGQHFLQPPRRELEWLGLEASLLDRPPSRVSSGQRQRLALLRSLAPGPRVLCADEPLANLDGPSAAAVESLLADYVTHGGILLLTSHRPPGEALSLVPWSVRNGEVTTHV